MSDRMHPPSLEQLLSQILDEYTHRGTVLEVAPCPIRASRPAHLMGGRAESLVGPAAGPHTQLAGNIAAAYAAGGRFFELKTVQTLDGEDLPVDKPCIRALDAGFNVEWSTELAVEQARDEYIKAWFLCYILGKELDLGQPGAFVFNMSVGYTLEGVSSPKIDSFINGMKQAASTPEWERCQAAAKKLLPRMHRVDQAFLDSIPSQISDCATLSTLHGCPAAEIEAIAAYLLRAKKLHTYVKLNPTIIGYQAARDILASLHWPLSFGPRHFEEDLQLADALPMLRRLLALAGEENVDFGVKLTNTLPVDIDQGQLPGEEMYLSGPALYPVSIRAAAHITAGMEERLPISFCGGVDQHNAADLLKAGLRPLTMATALLKPGGYGRLSQVVRLIAEEEGPSLPFPTRVDRLAEQAVSDPYYLAPPRDVYPRRKEGDPPLLDCFTPPCREACPLGQNVPAYLRALASCDAMAAARIVLERNPLPHITGEICPHTCTDSCTRRFLDQAIDIRGCKVEASREVSRANQELRRNKSGGRVAIVGGGPAGLAAAAFIQRAGWQATIFEKEADLGGVVRKVIPDFRISPEAVEKDVALVEDLGVEIKKCYPVTDIAKLRREYAAVILAVGAGKHSTLRLEQGRDMNALDFLAKVKQGVEVELGPEVCVVGGGNTAVDAARAALRCPGVSKVSIVYRRSQRHMPADPEEVALALQEGVELHPLRLPLSHSGAFLECEVMSLGPVGADGRPTPTLTGEQEHLGCTTLISALGELVDDEFYAAQMIRVDKHGLPVLTPEGESSRDNVYIIGDGAIGPATVAQAIAGARRAAEAITGCRFDRYVEEDCRYMGLSPRGQAEPGRDNNEAGRCLECGGRCLLCVETCPNRANRQVVIEGQPQIIHYDDLCNECGNCAHFCPWSGAPYKHKLTIFSSREALENSENRGLAPLPGGRYLLRNKGVISELKWNSEGTPSMEELLTAMIEYL